MNPKTKELIGGILAIILLAIYAVALLKMIIRTNDWNPSLPPVSFNPDRIWVVNLIGGVVAAVIIATLGISKPGGAPIRQVQHLSEDYGKNLLKAIVVTYISVWVLLGGSAFYVGVLKNPEASNTLNEIGKAWLGLVVGAVYAYFGINKPG